MKEKASVFNIFTIMSFLFVLLFFLYTLIFGNKFLSNYYDLFGYISGDLKDSIEWCRKLEPYRSGVDMHMSFPYPPLIVIFYYFISLFINPIQYKKYEMTIISTNSNFLLFYTVFMFVQILLITFCYRKIYRVHKQDKFQEHKLLFVSLIFIISYPFLLALERGNSLILCYLFVLIFLAFNENENKYLNEVSLISLAIAVNIKLYPVFYGLLLLKRENTKNIVKAILYGMILFLVPFFFLKGGFQNSLLAFVNEFTSYNSVQDLYHNFSLMGIIYTIFGNIDFINWKLIYYISLFIACPIIIINTTFDKKMYNKLLYIYLLILCFGRIGRYVHIFCFVPILYILCCENKANKENIFILIICMIFSIYYQILKFNLFIILYLALILLVLYVIYKFSIIVKTFIMKKD